MLLQRLLFAFMLFLFFGGVAKGGGLEVSVSDFLRAPVKERSVHGVAWDCLAAADLLENGDVRAAQRLEGDATLLVGLAIRSSSDQSVVGWSNNLTSRSCISGARAPCAGNKIVYAYQTGLSITCLSDAARLLGRPDLLVPVGQAVGYWNALKTKAPCVNCVYFHISDSQEDQLRYVRNMNISMAAGLAAYSKASGDDVQAEQALATIRSDIQDRNEGFRGYFGVLDSQASLREKERIENHLPSMAVLLNRIGYTLGVSYVMSHALDVWRDWATCDNALCRTKGCNFWAADSTMCSNTVTAAHCAFRRKDSFAKTACEIYLSKVRSVGSFGIISLLQ